MHANSAHILNNCKISLDQGKYTWRHNNIINYIVTSIDSSKFQIFSDLPGFQVAGGGSIPPEVCVTNLKPDLVIIDRKTKQLFLFELTVPFERNIEIRHTEKTNKYAHFVSDITSYETFICAFEIGSRGYIFQAIITVFQESTSL